MYKDKKILAIIPARGGSKGLKEKNIKPLLGKPLLTWTIEQAKASKFIDEIFVSTDDQKIADVAKNSGAEIKELRPQHLAQDDSKTIDLIDYILEYYGARNRYFDYIILLEPTSPLRKENDIDNAISLLDKDRDVDGIISVGKINLEHPQIVKKIDSKGHLVTYIEEAAKVHQRQMLDEAYFPYGVIYMVKTSVFKEKKTFYTDNVIPYKIERWQNYEIDDLCDFLCVENILKARIKGEL